MSKECYKGFADCHDNDGDNDDDDADADDVDVTTLIMGEAKVARAGCRLVRQAARLGSSTA